MNPPSPSIHYQFDRHPDSPFTVVLLHGFGGSLEAWEPIAAALHHQGYSVLRLDFPGQGKSPRYLNPHRYHPHHIAQDLHTFFHDQDITNAVLVGHCYGGLMAILYASLYPDLIRALVIINSTHQSPIVNLFRSDSNALKKTFRSLIHQNSTSDWSLKRIFNDIWRTTPYSYFVAFLHTLAFPLVKLSRLHLPILLLYGQEDSVIPQAAVEHLCHRLPSSHLEILPGANHIVILHQPQIIVDHLLPFLDRLKKN